jgi:hypothetical protein
MGGGATWPPLLEGGSMSALDTLEQALEEESRAVAE